MASRRNRDAVGRMVADLRRLGVLRPSHDGLVALARTSAEQLDGFRDVEVDPGRMAALLRSHLAVLARLEQVAESIGEADEFDRIVGALSAEVGDGP